jgi:hypothetical protein
MDKLKRFVRKYSHMKRSAVNGLLLSNVSHNGIYATLIII